MGPLIAAEHRERVASCVDASAQARAKVVIDGRRDEVPSGGVFLGTMQHGSMKSDMNDYRDEISGPILSVVRCDAFDDAVTLINRNHFANEIAIFFRDSDSVASPRPRSA